jgi:metal-sulfur cluster biosynthetic enzyme
MSNLFDPNKLQSRVYLDKKDAKMNFIRIVFAIFIVTASALEGSNASELNDVLKEVIVQPLSMDDLKVKIEVPDYEIKENHITTLSVSFDIDCSAAGCCPMKRLKGEFNARRPELEKVEDAVIHAQVDIEMGTPSNPVDSNTSLVEVFEAMKPMKKEVWENIFLKGLDEVKSQKIEGVSIEPRIVRKTEEGLIEAFAINLKYANGDKGKSCEYEILIELKTTSVGIQMNSTNSSCIFDELEQKVIRALDKLQKRDPAILGPIQTVVKSIQENFKKCKESK